jgi:uncharacterized protein (TIGR02246 family)
MSEATIAQMNARLIAAFAARDAAAAAAHYTTDGKLMVPYAEAHVGRDAIQACIEEGFQRGVARLGLVTVTIEVLGDTAWEEGLFTVWAADGKALDHGKYIVIWKAIGSEWLIARDIMSSNRPPS